MHVLTEQIEDFLIRLPAECAHQNRRRHFAVPIDTDGDRPIGIRFQFDPRAAIRNHLTAVNVFAEAVLLARKIHARRTDELRDDDTLGAIDDEGPRRGHDGEIAHEKIRIFLDFSRFMIDETRTHAKRRAVGHRL